MFGNKDKDLPKPKHVKSMGYDCVQFDLRVTMPERWVPHFLAMLKYMQYLGSIGASRRVTFYSDGDGDFRPQFKWHENLTTDARPRSGDNGHYTFDAG